MEKYLPEQIQEVLKSLRSSGYCKISALFSVKDDWLLYPCVICEREMKEVAGVHVFMPDNRNERAYVYFICSECEGELSAMDVSSKKKVFEDIEDKLVLLRARYRVETS